MARRKWIDKKTLIPIISAASIIAIIVVIMSLAPNIAIYGDFSRNEEYRFTTYSVSYVEFRNNNPFTVDQFKRLFVAELKITSTNEDFECSISGIGKKTPCYAKIDLGKIETGESEKLEFLIKPENNNFTIQARPYLNFFTEIPYPEKIWNCSYLGNGMHNCKELIK